MLCISHSLPSVLALQAWYNKQEGVNKLTTETGAGQWGASLAFACKLFDMECEVFQAGWGRGWGRGKVEGAWARPFAVCTRLSKRDLARGAQACLVPCPLTQAAARWV